MKKRFLSTKYNKLKANSCVPQQIKGFQRQKYQKCDFIKVKRWNRIIDLYLIQAPRIVHESDVMLYPTIPQIKMAASNTQLVANKTIRFLRQLGA